MQTLRQVFSHCTAFGRISHRIDTVPYKRMRHTYIHNLWVQPTAESAPQPERRCCPLRRWGTSWAWCTAAACTTTAASSPSGSAYPPSPASGRRGAGQYTFFTFSALQMKGQWESNINVWFSYMFSQKSNFAASLFKNRIIMLSLLIHIYLWEIYIFPGWVCLFCCSPELGPILRIYKPPWV